LYSISRADELGTTTRKLDYALTRGTSAVEIAGDVAHEVTQTEGRQIRETCQKQGVEILWHAPPTLPLGIPDRSEWRDAQDRITKSVRSAVYAGAKYVNFHACSNIWLELMTYAGRKLSMVFCDHDGNFIGKILQENKDLRKWFVQSRWQDYLHDILSREETIQVTAKSRVESDALRKEQISKQKLYRNQAHHTSAPGHKPADEQKDNTDNTGGHGRVLSDISRFRAKVC